MNNILWFVFAVIIGIFNAIAIAAAMLVIAPTISQAGAIAWICGGFIAGFLLLKGKHEMKYSKQASLELINTDTNVQQDIKELISTAIKCKLSSINLMIAYCDANGFTYSSEFSSYCLDCYYNMDWSGEE